MKKYINIAFYYAIAAMISGVFYREFTKFFSYTEQTALAFTHLHLFLLGTVMFLLIAILSCITNVTAQKQFARFMILYNVGLPFMVAMFFVRGITQVLNLDLSKGMNASISGLSGIAHIILAVAIITLFMALKKCHKVSINEQE